MVYFYNFNIIYNKFFLRGKKEVYKIVFFLIGKMCVFKGTFKYFFCS